MNWDQIESKWAEMTRRVQTQWANRDGSQKPFPERRTRTNPLPGAPVDDRGAGLMRPTSGSPTAE